jgi:hypothetical protein
MFAFGLVNEHLDDDHWIHASHHVLHHVLCFVLPGGVHPGCRSRVVAADDVMAPRPGPAGPRRRVRSGEHNLVRRKRRGFGLSL